MSEKACAKCGATKGLSEFNNEKGNKVDGKNRWCRLCMKEYNRKYRAVNSEKEAKRKSEYYQLNKDKALDYARRYREENREKRREHYRNYYVTNREAEVNRKRDWYRANRENDLERSAKYAKENRDKINSAYRVRYNKDVTFRLGKALRNRVRIALNGNRKKIGTIDLVGCTIEKLKVHLESQFTDGMTWDNYGFNGWHIDHIVPCAAFDLSDPEQQKLCFHYSNLQPLWAEDNFSKHAKLPHELEVAANG